MNNNSASYQYRLGQYRPDIDGLRALAVIAVLLFHFFPDKLKGGFVGVDVFFVISGFLVTGILHRELKVGKFSIIGFYKKRIRRLFPALIAVLLACLVAGSILLLSDEFENLGIHLAAGSTFLSNFVLYFESGYFDKSSDLKPLLHLWSLGIEEQFYLIWPCLLWFFFTKSERLLLPALLTVLIFSLTLNLGMTENYRAFSFFLLPTRLWELAIGGILALFWDDLAKPIKNPFLKWLRSILPMIGLILISVSFFVLNEQRIFPGKWVIPAVVGTVFIILGESKSFVNRTLSFRWIVYIGLISYPLYLWHWPLISFANIVLAGAVQLSFKFALICLSIVLAFMTYEWIEKPIRSRKLSTSMAINILVALFVLGGAGLFAWTQGGFPSRYKELEAISSSKVAFKSTPEYDPQKKCRKRFMEIELCAVSNLEREPTVALIGDSHANHLFPGLKEFYDSKNENLVLLAKSGTPPLINVISKRSPPTDMADVFSYVLSNPSIHTIILSGFWGNYFEENGVVVAGTPYKNIIEDKSNPSETDQHKIFSIAVERTVDRIIKTGKQAVIFYGIPALPFRLDSCRPRPFMTASSECVFPVSIHNEQQSGYREVLAKLQKEKVKLKILDPVPFVCENSTCTVVKRDKFIYSDNMHLSIEGSIALTRFLEQWKQL